MTQGIALRIQSNDTKGEYGETPLEFETPNPDPQSRYLEMLLTYLPNKHLQIISFPIATLEPGEREAASGSTTASPGIQPSFLLVRSIMRYQAAGEHTESARISFLERHLRLRSFIRNTCSLDSP